MNNKITYDDILTSLNMTVVNGKLVITRDINQERQKAGLEPLPPKPLVKKATATAAATTTTTTAQETALEKMKRLIKQRNDKKLFFQSVNTNVKPMQMKIL
jgi:hypothetical protein